MKKTIIGLFFTMSFNVIMTHDIFDETGHAINKSDKKIDKTFSDIGHVAKVLSPERVSSDLNLISLIFGEVADIINTTEQALQPYSQPVSSIADILSLIKTLQELVRVLNPTILLIEDQCYQLEDNFK